jgi:hypothetical protein
VADAVQVVVEVEIKNMQISEAIKWVTDLKTDENKKYVEALLENISEGHFISPVMQLPCSSCSKYPKYDDCSVSGCLNNVGQLIRKKEK